MKTELYRGYIYRLARVITAEGIELFVDCHVIAVLVLYVQEFCKLYQNNEIVIVFTV